MKKILLVTAISILGIASVNATVSGTIPIKPGLILIWNQLPGGKCIVTVKVKNDFSEAQIHFTGNTCAEALNLANRFISTYAK